MLILLIEDDPSTSKSINMVLSQAGFNVFCTDLGEEGVDLARHYDYDLILLDVNLPDISGMDVLRKLRRDKNTTPALILSGNDESYDKIRGLDNGADDYLTKPFNRDELIARIHAVVRRSKGHAQSIIKIGKINVNLDARTADVDGKAIPLTSKEYQILQLLALRKGTTMSKEMFLNNLYGGMDEPEMKIIDVFICKLRKKIAHATGGEHYIHTVWGRGYVMNEPSSIS